MGGQTARVEISMFRQRPGGLGPVRLLKITNVLSNKRQNDPVRLDVDAAPMHAGLSAGREA